MLGGYEAMLAALTMANSHYVQSAIALATAEQDEAADIARINARMTLHVSEAANMTAETIRPAGR